MNLPHANERSAGSDSTHDRRQRRMLVALAAFFFAPLAVAFFLYYGSGGWHPLNRVNRGDLIDPARPLPKLALPLAHDPERRTAPDFLQGKWTLLYFGSGACDERCRVNLYNTRQIRTALNRDMTRVQRVFLASGACCDWSFLDHAHPDLLVVRADREAAPLLAILPVFNGVGSNAAERIYLIDPLGNLMMSYAPEAAPKGMLTDLKRLLGLSQVG